MPEPVTVRVPGQPVPKDRPRFARGRTYSTKAQVAQEEAIGWALRAALGTQKFQGNVRVDAWFYRRDRQPVDLDNLLKLALDAGNGIAWRDDSQVTCLTGRLHLDPRHPRTVIAISDDPDSTLRRDPKER